MLAAGVCVICPVLPHEQDFAPRGCGGDRLNWRLILYLSMFGPAIGTLMVLGAFPKGMERFAWLAATVFCSIVIARRSDLHHFANGAVVGFISGATSILVQGLFAASGMEITKRHDAFSRKTMMPTKASTNTWKFPMIVARPGPM